MREFIAFLVFFLLCVAFIVIDGMHTRWAAVKALEEMRRIAEIEAQSAQPQGEPKP